jgi:hypothetical protein
MSTTEVDRGDLWVRCHGPFDRGFVYHGHRHWIDHETFVHGDTSLIVRYRATKHGEVLQERTFTGPCRFLVAAGLFHEIEVVSERGNWDCEFKKPGADSPLVAIYNQDLWD